MLFHLSFLTRFKNHKTYYLFNPSFFLSFIPPSLSPFHKHLFNIWYVPDICWILTISRLRDNDGTYFVLRYLFFNVNFLKYNMIWLNYLFDFSPHHHVAQNTLTYFLLFELPNVSLPQGPVSISAWNDFPLNIFMIHSLQVSAQMPSPQNPYLIIPFLSIVKRKLGKNSVVSHHFIFNSICHRLTTYLFMAYFTFQILSFVQEGNYSFCFVYICIPSL